MSFLLPCPNCGPRDVYEFRYGGEHRLRPKPDASGEAWVDYLYLRDNEKLVLRSCLRKSPNSVFKAALRTAA